MYGLADFCVEKFLYDPTIDLYCLHRGTLIHLILKVDLLLCTLYCWCLLEGGGIRG